MMGKVYSVLTKPIRTFNIANRAEKIISREKPVPAPHYASIEKQKKLSHEANPNFLEDHYRKNVQLDQRLKDVFVTSTDSQDEGITAAKESKSLPQNRYAPDGEFDYFFESTTIPIGKCSLKQVFTFLAEHKRDPVTHNSEHIAAQYKLDKEAVGNVLKYFKLYEITKQKTAVEEVEIDDVQEILNKTLETRKKKFLNKK